MLPPRHTPAADRRCISSRKTMPHNIIQKVKDNFYLYQSYTVTDPGNGKVLHKRKYIGKCDRNGNLCSRNEDAAPVVRPIGREYLMFSVMQSTESITALKPFLGDDYDLIFAYVLGRILYPTSIDFILDGIKSSFAPYLLGPGFGGKFNDKSKVLDVLGTYSDKVPRWLPNYPDSDRYVFEIDLMAGRSGNINPPGAYGWSQSGQPLRHTAYVSFTPEMDRPISYVNAKREYVFAPHLAEIGNILGSPGRPPKVFFLNGADRDISMIEGLVKSIPFSRVESADSEYSRRYLASVRIDPGDCRTMMAYGALYTISERTESLFGHSCRHIVMYDEGSKIDALTSLYNSMSRADQASAKGTLGVSRSEIELRLISEQLLPFYKLEDRPDGSVEVVRNAEKLRQEEMNLGKNLIVTNTDIPAEELVRAHLLQDILQKDIKLPKVVTKPQENPHGTGIGNALFMGDFLALSVLFRIRSLISGLPGLADMGPEGVLSELENIYAVRTGNLWSVSEIAPSQKKIFSDLGIGIPTDELANRLYGECTVSLK